MGPSQVAKSTEKLKFGYHISCKIPRCLDVYPEIFVSAEKEQVPRSAAIHIPEHLAVTSG